MSHRSVSTVMADVARKVFGATGRGIMWAVVGSGIDGTHQHFRRHGNLELPLGLTHCDFTVLKGDGEPLIARHGQGTHVAGIIAGEITEDDGPVWGAERRRTEWGTTTEERLRLNAIAGMAPECKLLSLKVLDDEGKGRTSNVIRALDFIQEVNGFGRRIIVHGVNLSVWFDYEPEWFACGHSPLCVEVDQLVKTGVVVVAAAGDTGFGYQQTLTRGAVKQSLPLSVQRSRQRQVRNHRWRNTSRHAAGVRRILLLVSRSDSRWEIEAGRCRAWSTDHVLSVQSSQDRGQHRWSGEPLP